MNSKITQTLVLIISFCCITLVANAQDDLSQEEMAITLAEEQLIAYNQRDIEAFLAPYSDNIKAYQYPNTLIFEGKDKMREIYGKMFDARPDLHCNLLNRTNLGNIVIDHEEVTLEAGKDPFYAIAIYKIEKNKIVEVRFIQK